MKSVIRNPAFRTRGEPTSGARAQPLVSVVIINYNYARYLGECIESVLAQNYEPMEVIVVDDGSTDESRAVIVSYGGRICSSFKQNGGVISATNYGFQLSRGSVVIFVDADDYLLPGAVNAHAEALCEPGVVRSQSYMTVLHATRSPRGRMPAKRAADGDLRELILERGPGAYVCPPTSGNAWARSFLEQIFPLPEGLKGVPQDALLMDSAPLFGKTVTLEHRGAAYRMHSDNASAAFAGMTLDNIQKILEHYEKRSIRLANLAATLGHGASPAHWKAFNWRILTLEYLSQRLSPRFGAPRSAKHLAAAFKIRGTLWKRLAVAAVILGIRVAPTKMALRIASRVIELRSM
jgi:glycosyltransferase involved in cell wall biosynthesis